MIIRGDSLETMRGMQDNQFDLAIVDPPYGINIETSGSWMRAHGVKGWDSTPPEEEYFVELKRVSKEYIIWGGNYFTNFLPPNNNWIIWHKMNDGMSFSMCEMAYSSIRKNIRLIRLPNNGARKDHPTQKPVKLYEWLLTNYAKPGDTILDTHLGSGSIAIACHNLGFDLTGYEIDQDYFEAATERLKEHQRQARLF
jgi:site-specific DNA-methyltransferase (adenine-specific)